MTSKLNQCVAYPLSGQTNLLNEHACYLTTYSVGTLLLMHKVLKMFPGNYLSLNVIKLS
jgi:hypothetical protein